MGKKFDNLVLHVGTDKTGSSSIQKALDASRDCLTQRKLLAYPPSHVLRPIGGCFFDDPLDYVHFIEDRITDKSKAGELARRAQSDFIDWLEKTPGCEFLVLSYEGYVSMPKKALERMRDFLDQFTRDCAVIYYARPPLSYVRSAISQSIKFGIDPYKNLPVVDHEKNLKKLEDVFGRAKLNIRKYEEQALFDGDVVKDFMHVCQVPIESTNPRIRENISLSDNGAALGLCLVSNLKEFGLDEIFNRAEFFKCLGRKLLDISGNTIDISEEQSRSVLDRSEGSISYLFNNYGVDLAEVVNIPHQGTRSGLSGKALYDYARLLLEEVLDFSDYRGKIEAGLTQRRIAKGGSFSIEAHIYNESSSDWYSTPRNPISASYYWTDIEGKVIPTKRLRSDIGQKVLRSGESKLISVKVKAPKTTGDYYLHLTLVREKVTWFDSEEFEAKVTKILVD